MTNETDLTYFEIVFSAYFQIYAKSLISAFLMAHRSFEPSDNFDLCKEKLTRSTF